MECGQQKLPQNHARAHIWRPNQPLGADQPYTCRRPVASERIRGVWHCGQGGWVGESLGSQGAFIASAVGVARGMSTLSGVDYQNATSADRTDCNEFVHQYQSRNGFDGRAFMAVSPSATAATFTTYAMKTSALRMILCCT